MGKTIGKGDKRSAGRLRLAFAGDSGKTNYVFLPKRVVIQSHFI
jgi:hypothetical protein